MLIASDLHHGNGPGALLLSIWNDTREKPRWKLRRVRSWNLGDDGSFFNTLWRPLWLAFSGMRYKIAPRRLRAESVGYQDVKTCRNRLNPGRRSLPPIRSLIAGALSLLW